VQGHEVANGGDKPLVHAKDHGNGPTAHAGDDVRDTYGDAPDQVHDDRHEECRRPARSIGGPGNLAGALCCVGTTAGLRVAAVVSIMRVRGMIRVVGIIRVVGMMRVVRMIRVVGAAVPAAVM
jgi:hypothetical protein